MALDLTPNPSFAAAVDRLYAGLMLSANPDPDRESGLGGKLLYAGQLDGEGRALVVAGNIAGAGSLAAASDVSAQKQAIRDGVVDFLVTSLDEALRILKNEIRKRETVAVCVAAAPETVEREMLERGVLPDLLPPDAACPPQFAVFLSQGARQVEPVDLAEGEVVATWNVASAPAVWLPKLDAIALPCLRPEDWPARRWLRLAPRYLGRLAQGTRLLRCDEETAARLRERILESVERGEIPVQVEVHTCALPAASIRAHSSFTP